MAMWHSRVCATSKWWIFSKMARGDEGFGKNKLYQRVIYWNNTLIDFLAQKIKVPHVRLRLRIWGWLEVKIYTSILKGISEACHVACQNLARNQRWET
jgi:hypothetical protein